MLADSGLCLAARKPDLQPSYAFGAKDSFFYNILERPSMDKLFNRPRFLPFLFLAYFHDAASSDGFSSAFCSVRGCRLPSQNCIPYGFCLPALYVLHKAVSDHCHGLCLQCCRNFPISAYGVPPRTPDCHSNQFLCPMQQTASCLTVPDYTPVLV